MGFYKSKFTGIEIDKRLEQGTYDDAINAGFKGTKEEFDLLLSQLKETTNKAADSLASSSDKLETINKDVVAAINEIHQNLSYKSNKNDVVDKEEFNKTIDTLNNNLVNSVNIINNNVNSGFNVINQALLETNTTLVEEINVRKNTDEQIIADVNKIIKPYTINLTDLLSAQDSESISAAIGGIDNLNGTVQKNQVIFGTLANGTVAVGIRVLGNQTTLTYFVDSVVGLTVNEVIITNTSGTLTKTANTHAVLTENMVINNLNSDETTLPLSAAQGKALSEEDDKLNNALGKPVIETVDLSTPSEVGYFWNVNGTKTASSAWNISESIKLTKGDLLVINNLSGSKVTNAITAVSNTGDFIDSLVTANGSEKGSYSYMADKDCTVQLSYSSTTSAYIVKSTQNAAIVDLTTSTAALHKVYESYGAVYNESTGYWEMFGLTDLTEEDMYNIWYESTYKTYASNTIESTLTVFWPSRKARIRVLKSDDSDYTYYSGFIFSRNSLALEVFRIVDPVYSQPRLNIANRATGLFYGCSALKDVGHINASLVNVFIVSNTRAFYGCQQLKTVFLRNLKVNVSFQSSPLISYESMKYLVDNAANTSAITVTVHPTTYSYLTGTAQPTAEVGGTTEEWQALVTTAQGKQISFAVPEETQSEVTE